jgi:hypothetical protein
MIRTFERQPDTVRKRLEATPVIDKPGRLPISAFDEIER